MKNWDWQLGWRMCLGAAALGALVLWLLPMAAPMVAGSALLTALIILVPPVALGMLVAALPGWDMTASLCSGALFLAAVLGWIWYGTFGIPARPGVAVVIMVTVIYLAIMAALFAGGGWIMTALKARLARGGAG